MRIWNGNKVPSTGSVRRTRRGFTLVELIVVLTILAILAAIGVGSAVGYIKKSKFDRNSENAISVYQAAQTALTQKVENGTIDSWLRHMPGVDVTTDPELIFEYGATINSSRHKTVALTFNPKNASGAEDAYLYSLLSPYFYDSTVFGGTISVEFDVSATYSPNGIVYSANVMSAFYSKENTAASGWDAIRLGDSTDGLRALMRQDPDVIMVGETRDAETASISIRAAVTGHLVLSTLHTNDAASTIVRLIDIGAEPYMLSSALVGVVAQRLMRKVCPYCAQPEPLTETQIDFLGHDIPNARKGRGCAQCHGSGYLGRTAIHEVLVVDKTMRKMIARNAEAEEMKQYAIKNQNMQTLRMAAEALVAQGITSMEELERVAYNDD